MQIGVISRSDAEGWGLTQLRDSLDRKGVTSVFLSFPSLLAKVACGPVVQSRDLNVASNVNALFIRSVGHGSLEEIIFRMDLLQKLEREQVYVVNPTKAIERCVDKYYALTLLEENNLPVPRTIVTESVEAAIEGFNELGQDVVIKPIFGARGVGLARISDLSIAERVFSTIRFHHGILYVQEYIAHGDSDIRAFVVDDHVVAAMRRVSDSWKTNISQGAVPHAIHLSDELETLATRAAKAIDCKIAGVDILEGANGPFVIEINSQPGWMGLQSVTQTNIADSIVDFIISAARK
ncbi:MAG: RimK family alpha-L-glutamate ligase [Candidatus Bathyarchaeota archaeon]|nr:MAG: RimK family alpha-L-glutamate ligase [Candidatus Bathyarchaeota archaeon]